MKLPLGALLVLAATAFMTVMTELLPAGLLPQMSRAFAVPEGQAGFLVSGYAAASFFAAIPLLATHMPVPEIAAELFLAPSIIKWQLKSVYRKLGASSRGQAVAQSRELGLLEG